MFCPKRIKTYPTSVYYFKNFSWGYTPGPSKGGYERGKERGMEGIFGQKLSLAPTTEISPTPMVGMWEMTCWKFLLTACSCSTSCSTSDLNAKQRKFCAFGQDHNSLRALSDHWQSTMLATVKRFDLNSNGAKLYDYTGVFWIAYCAWTKLKNVGKLAMLSDDFISAYCALFSCPYSTTACKLSIRPRGLYLNYNY